MPDGDDAAAGRPGRGPLPARRRLEPKPAAQPRPEPEETVGADDMEDLPDRDPVGRGGLPHGTALLRIYDRDLPNGESCFGYEVHSCCTEVKIFDDLRYGRPDLALHDNATLAGPLPVEFFNQMRVWSKQQGRLTRWLYDRRCCYPQLKLVISDSTPSRIPWEMLWLPSLTADSGPERGFLGAVVEVTRQFKLNGPFPELMRTSEIPAPYLVSGPVAAYIADKMKLDRGIFTGLTLDDEIRSMEDLFESLAGNSGESGPVAMVYVACHATFGDRPEECVIDDFPYTRTADYDDDELFRLRVEPTLVFLNSCDTGLMGVDARKYNDGALRGFAEVFLRAGAAGVLATTGAVGTSDARVLAGKLLSWLKANSGLSVAEGVRQLRAEALAEIKRNRWWFRSTLSPSQRYEANMGLLPLLYPFMYVYFGGPWMVPANGPRSDVGEPAGTGGPR